MQIQFIGAAQFVTGSKHLLKLDTGTHILLDCGLFQGRKKVVDALNREWGFSPAEINYVLLSHAHIDHCGLLPKLYKDGFRGKIFCTPATLDLCHVMLPDSAHIQEYDTQWENKRRIKAGKPLLEALYDADDAAECLKLFVPLDFNTPHAEKDFRFSFHENGHLLGSAGIHFTAVEPKGETTLFFTGDIGRYTPQMLRLPEPFPEARYVISESTYGDRLHDDEDYSTQDLVDILVETCVNKQGKLIIPAFSIGRTQEIIYALDYLRTRQHIPKIKVFVDSPLSTKGTDIFRKHLHLFNKQFQEYLKTDSSPLDFDELHFIQTVDESKALNSIKEPCIIISASGMMDAGRIRHHIFNNIENPDNTLLIVGYCEPSTLGGRIIAGAKVIRLFGQELQVKARVEYIRSYSGHGDYKEMIRYLNHLPKDQVKKLFLVHGEPEAQAAFRSKLLRQHFRSVEIPERGDIYELE